MSKIVAAILACVVVMAPTLLASARNCEQRGGVLVRGQFGIVCKAPKRVAMTRLGTIVAKIIEALRTRCQRRLVSGGSWGKLFEKT